MAKLKTIYYIILSKVSLDEDINLKTKRVLTLTNARMDYINVRAG